MTELHPERQVVDKIIFGKPRDGLVVLLKLSNKWQVRYKISEEWMTTEQAIAYAADFGNVVSYRKASSWFNTYRIPESEYLNY